MITMDAATVKAALRRRHPAEGAGSMVGQWTCIEEWANVDLIALNAWRGGDVIGYEVKVSRSDMRGELLAPLKRADAVAMCTEFYFAVPAGMLKPDEIVYSEPQWEPEDWHRMRCPGVPSFGPPDQYALSRHRAADLLDLPSGRYGGPCHGRGHTGTSKAGRREKGPFTVRLPIPWAPGALPDYVDRVYDFEARKHGSDEAARAASRREHAAECIRHAESNVLCPACGGKGYLERSRVEAEAPTLWVPRDVGLIEISSRGCHVVRKAPRRSDAPGLIAVAPALRGSAGRGRQNVNQLIRWVSNRPDPRHAQPARGQEMAA